MIPEDDPEQYRARFIRQVLFNSSLEQIEIIEDPEEGYVDPIDYLCRHGLKKPVTWENLDQCMPFLEVAVFYKPGDLDCSYIVNFHAESRLDNEMWKKIRDAVKSALDMLEQEADGYLFYSREADDAKMEEKRPFKLALAKKRWYADLIQQRRKHLMEEIPNLMDAGATAAEIADRFRIDEEDVSGLLDQKRPQVSEVADSVLMKEILLPLELGSPMLQPLTQDGDVIKMMLVGKVLADELGFGEDDLDKLKNEILNRGRYKTFPKRKPPMSLSKRALLYPP